jgi:hypothetical protein
MAYIKETAFGEEVTGSNLQIIRPTGEGLKADTDITVSQEIRSDRQTANVVRTGFGVSGAINFELTHDSFDDWLEAGLQSAGWSTPVVDIAAETTISFVAAGQTINDSANGLAGYDAYQWILVSGAGVAANNGLFKIKSVAAGTIEVYGSTIADESAGSSVSITQGKYIENGVTLNTYNIERIYSDLTTTIAQYLGMGIESLVLDCPVAGLITGNFGFLGSSVSTVAASGGSGYDAATTTVPMSAVNDVSAMAENDVGINFVNYGINVANNLRQRRVAGQLGATSLGVGKFEVSGSLETYFETATLFDKYLDQTLTSLALQLVNAAGETYIIDIPSVRLTDGSRDAEGENQDVMASLEWTGFMDATEGITMRIASIG